MFGVYPNKLVLALLIYIFSFSVLASVSLKPIDAVHGASEGLLVKFKINTSLSSQSHALSASGLKVVERFKLVPGLSYVAPVAGENQNNTLAAIQSDPNVEYAEPNFLVYVEKVPDDSNFDTQYGFYNTGQTGGKAGADVAAADAWEIATGTDVVVAVIDTGVDYSHSDLRNNMWINPGEIDGNNIDDDGNGYIDDMYGWDFSNADADPMDDMGHGTHVAGIIAAEGNNTIGLAGVNWSARIMALKFIDASGVGSTSRAIKALNYAVAMGAKISNNSWGGAAYSQALVDALTAAETAGHIFVAAAGNTGTNTDNPINDIHYPSSYPMDNVISVASTDEFDNLGSFSNYGNVSVDLAAPGKQINSLWLSNAYLMLDGTSMSAPFVAGAAALVWSVKPELTMLQVRSALLDHVDVLPSLEGRMVTNGRLNLFKSLSSVGVSMQISPDVRFLSVNDIVNFSATGGTPPYQWSVNNPAVASIDSATGIFTAIAGGRTHVIVTDSLGFKTNSFEILIENIIISPEVALLNIGDQQSFSASGGVQPYIWSSTNPLVASIDASTGMLTALSAGQTQVIVHDTNNFSVHSGVIDVAPRAALSMFPRDGTLSVSETLQFSAQGGSPPYAWVSSDPSVAVINGMGNLTAMAPGSTVITLTDASGISLSSNPVFVESLTMQPVLLSMKINETQQISATGGAAPFEWTVTNSLVAQINNTGLLTAIAPGSVKVTLRDANGLQATSDTILISDSSALSMTVNASVLGIGETIPVDVKGGVLPYSWSSSDPTVLQVNPSSKNATSIGAGLAYISISDAAGKLVSSPIIEVRQITISAQQLSYVIDDIETFFATGGVAPYVWQVDNEFVATIDNNGNFHALSEGVVNVGVIDSDGIRGDSIMLTVSSAVNSLHSIEVTPRSATLSRRSTSTITFIASGGLTPYKFQLTSPIGTIDPVSGEYSPLSDVAGTTTVLVTDADGHVVETSRIEVK